MKERECRLCGALSFFEEGERPADTCGVCDEILDRESWMEELDFVDYPEEL